MLKLQENARQKYVDAVIAARQESGDTVPALAVSQDELASDLGCENLTDLDFAHFLMEPTQIQLTQVLYDKLHIIIVEEACLLNGFATVDPHRFFRLVINDSLTGNHEADYLAEFV